MIGCACYIENDLIIFDWMFKNAIVCDWMIGRYLDRALGRDWSLDVIECDFYFVDYLRSYYIRLFELALVLFALED